MASAASEIDPAAEPHVVVEETPSAGGSEGEAPPEAAAVEVAAEKEAVDGEAKEEEEGECGFCLFMKAGACKEAFVSWEQCVQASEKDGYDIVERCSEATINLKKCMDAHADYYEPVFRAEQQVSDKAEAAISAADADKNNVEESAPSPTDETKKEEAAVEPAASAADAKEEVIEQAASSTAADAKEEVVEQEASSKATEEEEKKEEAAVEKVESSSLGN